MRSVRYGWIAHALPLAGAERPALVPDRVRDPQPAEVVHEARAAQRAHRALGQPEPRAGLARPGPRPRAAWPSVVRRLQVDEVRDRQQRRVEALAGEHDGERRLGLDHRSHVPTASSPPRIVSASAQMSAGQRGVELLAARACGRAPSPPRRRRPGARPRRTRPAARGATRPARPSPSSSPGQPRPSHCSYDAAERREHARRAARAARPGRAPWRRGGSIMSSISRWPESANSSPTRKRCSGGLPEPEQPHARRRGPQRCAARGGT